MSGSDDTIAAALQFVQYVYKKGQSDFSGTVLFQVSDSSTGESFKKSVQVKAGENEVVLVHGEPPSALSIDCVVKVEKTVLLAILTGALDARAAFMFGQISADNLDVLTKFIGAFEFKKEKFQEFQQGLSKQETDVNANTATTEPSSTAGEVPTPLPSNDAPELPVESKEGQLTKPPEQLPNSPRPSEFKQNLAIGGLKLLAAVKTIAKEVDGLVDRVKESEGVQKALTQLEDEAATFKASDVYQKMQASTAFNSLKGEFEKASAVATVITAKAKDKSLEVVESITKTAYPTYVPTVVDLSAPLPNNPAPIVTAPSRSVWANLPSHPSPTLSRSVTSSSPSTTAPVAASTSSIPSTITTISSPVSTTTTSTTPTPTPSTVTTTATASPKTSTFFQSLKTAVSSPSFPRLFEDKATKEAREAKEREEKEAKVKEAKEKERLAKEAKEKVLKEAKEKEEQQREDKRKQLQAKLELLQKHNEETTKQIQEDAKKRQAEQEEKKKLALQKPNNEAEKTEPTEQVKSAEQKQAPEQQAEPATSAN